MFHLGLRAKFILYSNTVIAVTMTIATLLAAWHDRATQFRAVRDHTESVAGALATAITDALMYEDLGLITESGLTDNYIAEIRQQHGEHLRYVIVSNPDGVVTNSNRWTLLGSQFPRALTANAIGRPPQEIQREEDGEHLMEVSVPLNIGSKFWGSLTLGYSLVPLEQELTDFKWRLIQVAGLLMLANSLLTMFYVESLIRPILRLHQTMGFAGKGDLGARVWSGAGDEVSQLGEAFNRMMDELETAREAEQARQTHLAHTEKMAALGTLAAGVAHEVNNPLAGILACIENMRADPENRDMRERYLGLIRDGLLRIEHTIAKLLDFSRGRELRAELTSLNQSLRHTAELVEYQIRKANVELRLDLDPAEPTAMADRFQLEQVFLNLTLNALQAMPGGGTLTLRTKKRDGVVLAEVADTGTGIPASMRRRIFDPFFTTRPVGEGTGLGLSVSDSIVGAHGGRIDVESEPGRGSVFRIILPVGEPAIEPHGGRDERVRTAPADRGGRAPAPGQPV